MNIVVLAGGLSPERNVSLSSGSLISAALRRRGHRVCLLDVYEGINSVPENMLDLFTTENSEIFKVGTAAPTPEELAELRARNGGRTELVGPNVLALCKAADVAFLALHGDMGENGQLQATLDVFDVTYTGSGYVGSLLAMNKDVAKKLLRADGILTPDWIKFEVGDDIDVTVASARKIGYPLIVKPCSCGSSVGVSMVDTPEELSAALDAAAKYESSILIEKRIFGREFTQGYVGGEVLPPVEIIPHCGFYDYANKYIAGATEEICPAPITDEELVRMSDATKRGFLALNLADYARFDYIMDEKGDFYCLEANTLPGMTPTSLLPQEAKATGVDYDTLCEKLALLAIKKKK